MGLFKSFWQAGYEGADHINRSGIKLSMNDVNAHNQYHAEDYNALRMFDIKTVRESVCWRIVEQPRGFDFSSVAEKMASAKKAHCQICWTICHYGWPDDIDIYSEDFIFRFARLCGELATFLRPLYAEAPVYSPVNEISFTSWGISVGLFATAQQVTEDGGFQSKKQLVKAALAASDAIWAADPRARILHCDPLIFLTPPDASEESQKEVSGWHEAQFEAWDMLAGKKAPELGGAPRYLDLIGANYYHDNQWEFGTNQRLSWHLGCPQRQKLHHMLHELWLRYSRPILLAETSHVGSGRGAWITDVTREVAMAQLAGVEIVGICLYPVIDRPDWDNLSHWNHSGLWEVNLSSEATFTRELNTVYARALWNAQRMLRNFQHPLNALTFISEARQSMKTLYVFSHLRWDFVFQRPQHLLTRLAEYYKIVFIEVPLYAADPPALLRHSPAPNVTVIQPQTPEQAPGFHDGQIAWLQPLLAELVQDEEAPIVWFYTPMALPLLNVFPASLVIYDCMDELAAFEQAPRQLLQRESALLSRADIVFTGGPGLYEARAGRHPNIHCFASSVDAVHFEQALDRENHHPLQDAIPHPRLGFYGVIDERMDLELIAAIADAHTDWQLVMVGPVVKIDPRSLPQRSNIHYLGMQPYQALPQFLAGWDVCLMPFALNASTQFISPTKVLEYMAAQLPVVSTAITDVKKSYEHVVAIAGDAAQFIAACEEALAQPAEKREAQRRTMEQIVAATSWEQTVAQMHTLIEAQLAIAAEKTAEKEKIEEKKSVAQRAIARPALRLMPPSVVTAPCLILGAGPTGLSAAYHYGEAATLLERNSSVGGLCRSVTNDGFTFDYAGHIMFSNDPYVLELYTLLLGDNVHWQAREAWVYTDGVYTRYPFQGSLFGLPAAVIKECILGAIEARYGLSASDAPPTLRCQPHAAAKKVHTDCCADGSVPDFTSTSTANDDREEESFETFIYKTWGKGIARHFAIPYNQKLWTVPLSEMETSWLGGRVPLPDLAQIIAGALEETGKPMGPNARFGYPLKGGFQALMSGFLPLIKGTVETGAEVKRISVHQHRAMLADGRCFDYEQMISTLPLPQLIRLIDDPVPSEVRKAALGLRHVSVRCVNLGIDRANLTNKHWIYFAGKTVFHRIFVQGNASPFCSPPGGCGLTCEISYSADKPLPEEGDALTERCIRECIEAGIFSASDRVVTTSQVDIPCAYVIYDHHRKDNVATVRHWLLQHDITLAGRYSEWEYYNSDHAFIAGKLAVEKVRSRVWRHSGS
jgi:protoporphyrinogen oxidase/glycosyltransferase involved in cell wall biosynthesis